MESLFGLPAHPLIVHAAVVLVPLAALGTIAIAVWPAARRRLGWIVVAFALGGFITAWMAKESGEPLEEKVEESQLLEDHAELGEALPAYAFVLFVTSAGVMGLDEWRRRRLGDGERPSWFGPATAVVAVIAVTASVVTTIDVARVGHSGARATWQEIQDQPSHGDADEDD